MLGDDSISTTSRNYKFGFLQFSSLKVNTNPYSNVAVSVRVRVMIRVSNKVRVRARA